MAATCRSPTYELWSNLHNSGEPENVHKAVTMVGSLTAAQLEESYYQNASYFFGITNMFDKLVAEGATCADGPLPVLKKRLAYVEIYSE